MNFGEAFDSALKQTWAGVKGLVGLALVLGGCGLLGLSVYSWAVTGVWGAPSVYDFVVAFFGVDALSDWVGIANAAEGTEMWTACFILAGVWGLIFSKLD
ncbi:hypothetical protein KMP13_02215 [Epibacterium ulvae]|uniref:hypothetical protein n=1 Tax=Epibacterium ulvae TaxID=1156985 RepID=UPI001BFC4C09|nr:hypothetical protein [Epibacterium ulvae]MBT8152728.1 hypothetical protein [Epibacterium ulvae]